MIHVKITFISSSTKCHLTFLWDNNSVEGLLSVLPNTVKFNVVIGTLPDSKEFVEMAAMEELAMQKRGKVVGGTGYFVVRNTFEAVERMLSGV